MKPTEVDETYIGAPREGKRGRGAFNKQIVFVAAERKILPGGKKSTIGRVRLMKIPDVTGGSLVLAVTTNIEPGSVIVTDGWGGYNGIESAGYIRTLE